MANAAAAPSSSHNAIDIRCGPAPRNYAITLANAKRLALAPELPAPRRQLYFEVPVPGLHLPHRELGLPQLPLQPLTPGVRLG